MRALTIVDCQTVEIDSDDLLYRRLQRSVEITRTKCDVCGMKATRFVRCDQARFNSYRCDKDSGPELINHPDFRGEKVSVELLGQRQWTTYENGEVQHESRGQ